MTTPKFKIPKNVNDLLIKDYIIFAKIQSGSFEYETDRLNTYLSYFTGKDFDYIDNLPVAIQENLWLKLSPLLNSKLSTRRKSFWLNGKRYKACKNEKHFNFGQWASLKEFEKDQYGNIHKILAVIYANTPLFKSYEYKDAEFEDNKDMFYNKVKIGQVYGTFFFYCQRFELLKVSSQLSLELANQTIQNRIEEVKQEMETIGLPTDGTVSDMSLQVATYLKNRS
jgi:hypothetical protein